MKNVNNLSLSVTALMLITVVVSALLVSLPVVYAKDVTIEVDIDAAGNVTLTPNPTSVTDGDVVWWHIRHGTYDRGFRVILPAGADSPFGNRDYDKILSISPASTCSRIDARPPIQWPSGVTQYNYRAETFQSPATTYTIGTLVAGGVGGTVVSVDKLGLLAPYVGLVSTIIVATVATAICVKRRREKNENEDN